MSSAAEFHKRVVDLIGKEAADTLELHGFGIVAQASIDKFVAEHKASTARVREVAAATMRAAGLMTVRTEITAIEGNPSIIVTHPLGDEDGLALEIAGILSKLYHPRPGGRAPTDEEKERLTKDTNDVDIQAKAEDDLPRSPVLNFAVAMEMRLRRFDSKGGWSALDLGYLLQKLEANVGQVRAALSGQGPTSDPQAMLAALTDVANFAMMSHEGVLRVIAERVDRVKDPS